jgi:ankyrin repeat protein
MDDLKTFHDHVKQGDLSATQADLAAHPELLDQQNEAGQSAFLLASYYRKADVAAYLLSLNPKLDVFTAAVAGLTNAVLAHPAALEAHSPDGWTPLHLAAHFGHAELIAALLDKGANVDVASSNHMQNTPLHAAVAGQAAPAVRLLLLRGANANARQHGGWTALHGAAQNGDREMVETLLAHGAQLDARAENGQTPLDLAFAKGRHEVVDLLSELGAPR